MTIDEAIKNLEYGTEQLEMEIKSGLWVKGSESELCCKDGIALNKQHIEWLTELKEAKQLLKAVKWISVKDRLPDDCVEVLVYDTDCGIVIGWYDKKDSIFVAEFMNELDAVTHWMPLPKLPKDSEHG